MTSSPIYRMLTAEEWDLMRDDFVQFLISNGIDATEWLKIKELNKEEAEVWMIKFSDVVLQKSLEKIKFIEFRSPHRLMLFNCEINAIHLAAITSEHTDLTNFGEADFSLANKSDIAMFVQSKQYYSNRETEIFKMMQNGALVTDDKLFNWVKEAVERLRNLT
jgi:hypothetical protein